ncbi:flavin monoamine oxidase family protein [Streptomyces rapamycinicus]|uniref:Amine oxidase n=2 Tax=Streptomyces rapamycinicus TaxID=1226757 RepID=A0A3L8RHJ8_STRRN|nr:NAD(P)/FAD-dependent oxidoreductase [Streptomyces rapamycinicus]MBB4785434.1 tryptophan 2-monooxygenase [Streptomyces rapamycinicus]RLV79097.1 amine oxidase [Streptomyces rapamycinicus NRRL 5491]UTO65622.1 FAD-dependent oxidoreductase [Streptomyces rapamycinicus]UTP33579.1 FAD-dependent oxidoreductase [Streptomyces rapamycinicus NRRL 5491]
MTCATASATTMLVPDFPFSYDRWLSHPAGLGALPAALHGTEVAVIGGGMSGLTAAYELLRLGLSPVLYEAEQLGGRMRSTPFPGNPEYKAEMGAMRFPVAARSLFHYIDLLGLSTRPFPNPLAPATASTLIDLNGGQDRARTVDELPEVYQEVADAWDKALQERADLATLRDAIQRRDVTTLKTVWNSLVKEFDDQSFYGFLATSSTFQSFRHREIFGQVGFGTGGWDTDFPNSVLEILRVVVTEADDNQVGIVGGSSQVPNGLWEHRPETLAHWPRGTSLASLHGGRPRPAVTRLRRTADGIRVTDESGEEREFPAVVFSPHVWTLLNRVDCDPTLLSTPQWTAVERTHYMGASKLFVLVDRPFWRDTDPATGHDTMSMTLTDRMPRGVYLFDDGPDRPGVMCLSYTWNDDSLKVATLSAEERLETLLSKLAAIYPDVDIRSHIIGGPLTVTWETEPRFMGAFKNNLPGHYRYQRRLFTQFMQDGTDPGQQGFFLCGDDVSWTAGFAEGAVTTALNAVWGVLRHLGGTTHPDNPGPGDLFETFAPLELPYD